MSLFKTCGSLSALLLVISYNAINAPLGHAAQLGLGDSLEETPNLNTETAQSDVCEEEPVISPEALQKSSEPLSRSLGPNLIANVSMADTSPGLLSSQESQTWVAQGELFEDCGIGGVAPEGGLPAAAGFPLAAALIPAGAAAAALPFVIGGSDDPAPTPPANNPPAPPVPEPAETATAGLFACLGIVGVLARRKLNQAR